MAEVNPDIVERIRKRFPRPLYAEDGLLSNEAADEITRLRAELAEAQKTVGEVQSLRAELDLWKRVPLQRIQPGNCAAVD